MGHSRIFCDDKAVFAMSKAEELGLIFAEEPQALEPSTMGYTEIQYLLYGRQ